MITRDEVDRLMDRHPGTVPVLSLYVDLGVGPGDRHTHEVFLARQRRGARALAAEHASLRPEAVREFLDRASAWIGENLPPASAGAAIFGEAGGEWFEAYLLPVPLPNRLQAGPRPAVAPLVNALQGRRRHAVVLVDRERLRLLLVWLGTVLREEAERRELYPAAHDVQAGGPAAHRYQQRMLEEQRQNFAAFSDSVARFVERTRAENVVLLGTEENVARLRRVLPLNVLERVTHTGSAPVDAPVPEVLARLEAVLDTREEGEELVHLLRERAATGYRAATGVQKTLSALQNGAVEAAVLADGGDALGARCTRCGFLFSSVPKACPFDGAPVERGVPVVEEAIRLATAQGARIRLVAPEEAAEFAGAGALLRF